MSRRSIVSLAATIIIGSACIVIASDTFAYSSGGIPIWQPGEYRGGVYRAYHRRGYYRGAVGAAAARGYYVPRCGYSPYGPCF